MVDDLRSQIRHKYWYVEEKIQQRTVGGNKNVSN